MRKFKLFSLFLLFTLIASMIVGSAAAQDYRCIGFSIQLRNDDTVAHTATIYFGRFSDGSALTHTASLTLQPGESGFLRLYANIPDVRFFLGGGPGGLTIIGADDFGNAVTLDTCNGGRIDDGRVNDGPNQLAAPVAVYCAAPNIEVYKINAETGEGSLVIQEPQVSGEPESGENQLLASAEGVTLSWLANGSYQINTVNFEGNPFIIAWNGCDGGSLDYIAPRSG
ncbi:MAG: hypothetical protein K8L99_35435 [Anaerolineae bacterium]|nr:hypothetical protein [Anaerolineae bacterium]